MPKNYKEGQSVARKLTNTIRKGEKVISLAVEGEIWNKNGFNFDDLIIIKPIKKGQLLIKRITD